MSRALAATLLALLAALAGCSLAPSPPPSGTGTPTAAGSPSGAPGPADASPTPPSSPAPAGLPVEIELAITGGPHDGSYRAVADGGCDSQPVGNQLSLSYADDSAPDGFVALHVVLRNASQAEDDESDDFLAEISLGAGQGISYTLDPVAGQGSASALLELSDTGAIIDIGGEAPDGAEIELSVICGSE